MEVDNRLYHHPGAESMVIPNIPATIKTVSEELQPNSKQGLRKARADCIWQRSQTL